MKIFKNILTLFLIVAFVGGINISAQQMPFEDVIMSKYEESVILLYNRGIVTGREDGKFHPEENVTTAEFVAMLLRDRFGNISPTSEAWWSGYMDKAVEMGLAEDLDCENAEAPITRKATAKLLHEALLKIYAEDDVEWSVAENLKDLYTCRTCVMHIAQVYVKGIMPAKGDVFDLDNLVTRGEAAEFVARIIAPDMRTKINTAVEASEIQSISYEEAQIVLKENDLAILVDVRDKIEREKGYIEGSISIPLDEIISGVGALPEDKNTTLIIYCTSGMKSKKACAMLLEMGYVNVFDMGAMK